MFRDFVAIHRPKLDIEKVATGEHWYGTQALELNLVDEIKTSDEFLVEALDSYDIYQIEMQQKKGLQEKIFGGLFASVDRLTNRIARQQNESRYH